MNWGALESLLTPTAVSATWRSRLGQDYDAFRAGFLQRTSKAVRNYPCPNGCGCAHEVIRLGPLELVGACRCEERACDDLPLSPEDVTLWRLNWPRLGAALCEALTLRPRTADLKLCNTYQIGAWGAQAIPVVLTVQSSALSFREVLVFLTARLRSAFILLAPTAQYADVRSQELLASVGAGCFGLEGHVKLTASGCLYPIVAPGELFARFTPGAADPVNEDVSRRAFALVKQLDSEQPLLPPTVLTVFRLYCVECLSAAQVARRCGSSKATVIRRLEQIQRRTGMDPQALRRVSPHLEKIRDEFRDSRAARIHARSLIDDE